MVKLSIERIANSPKSLNFTCWNEQANAITRNNETQISLLINHSLPLDNARDCNYYVK